MVSNETIDFALQIIEQNQDYSNKLIILGFFLFYLTVSFFLSYRYIKSMDKAEIYKNSAEWWLIFLSYGLMFVNGAIISVYPMLGLFLHIDIDFQFVLNFVYIYYGTLFICLTPLAWVWGLGIFFHWLGISPKTNIKRGDRK